jgi:putative acetyltransferase
VIVQTDRTTPPEIAIRAARSTDRDGMLHVQIAALQSIGTSCDRDFYTPDEVAALVKSKQRFHALDLYYYRCEPKRGQRFDLNFTLVATIDTHEIVGFAALEGDRVTAVFVHPQYARQKIATRLLWALEQIAIEQYLETIKVSSSLNARSFYRSCGYAEITRSKITIESSQDKIAVVEMVKNLPPPASLLFRTIDSYLAKCWRLLVRIFKKIARSR